MIGAKERTGKIFITSRCNVLGSLMLTECCLNSTDGDVFVSHSIEYEFDSVFNNINYYVNLCILKYYSTITGVISTTSGRPCYYQHPFYSLFQPR